MKLGSIILYKDIEFWFSWIQRKITRFPYSHSSIYIGINELGRQEEFEANYQVDTTTFKFKPDQMEIYEIIGLDIHTVKDILNDLIDTFEERSYGWLQILTFVRRAFFDLIGIDTRHWKVWFKGGVLCSELVWYLLYWVAKIMGWFDLQVFLEHWSPDCYHSGDIKTTLITFPQYFRKRK